MSTPAIILYVVILSAPVIADLLDWLLNFPKKYILTHEKIVEEDKTEPLWI